MWVDSDTHLVPFNQCARTNTAAGLPPNPPNQSLRLRRRPNIQIPSQHLHTRIILPDRIRPPTDPRVSLDQSPVHILPQRIDCQHALRRQHGGMGILRRQTAIRETTQHIQGNLRDLPPRPVHPIIEIRCHRLEPSQQRSSIKLRRLGQVGPLPRTRKHPKPPDIRRYSVGPERQHAVFAADQVFAGVPQFPPQHQQGLA